jgi:hypothetical protein
MTFFHTDVVFNVELVVTRLLCGMRTRPAVAGILMKSRCLRVLYVRLIEPSSSFHLMPDENGASMLK